jgi:two-component system chemotaxis response regulator CheY
MRTEPIDGVSTMRILVVDESSDARTEVRLALEELRDCACEVLEARNGNEALELLRDESLGISAALVDWDRARQDRIDFLKQLHEMERSREIPVVMISRQPHLEPLLWGACDCVLKPVDPEALQGLIRDIAARLEARKCEETSVLLRVAASTRESSPFLDRLPDEVATDLRALATPAFHAAGAQLVRPGQRVDALPLLLLGEVAVASPDQPGLSEIRRPGETFAEQAFFWGLPSEVGVRARTAGQVLTLTRAQLGELVRRHPEIHAFVARLVVRSSPTRGPANLLLILNLCRKTGRLRLESSGRRADLYFVEGELRHAEADHGLFGASVLYRAIRWTDAAFSYESGVRPPVVSIEASTQELLSEGKRLLEEDRRGT